MNNRNPSADLCATTSVFEQNPQLDDEGSALPTSNTGNIVAESAACSSGNLPKVYGTAYVGLSTKPYTPSLVSVPGAKIRCNATPTDSGADFLEDSLQALDEDDEHLYADEFALIGQADRSAAYASASIPLLRVNRTNLRALLSNIHFPFTLRCSLLNFLSRYKRSDWMRWQHQFPQRIGVALASNWEYGNTIALCGYNGWLCQKPDYCPRCSLMKRAKPAVREYRHSFLRANFWYAISPSFEQNPARAGLHFVIQKRDEKAGIKERVIRFNPYQGAEPGIRLTADHHLGSSPSPVLACFDAVFGFADWLAKLGVAGGVFAHREIAWHFRPFWIDPNGHFLINTNGPLSVEHGEMMLRHFEQIYAKQPQARLLYPDLHIEQLVSQREVNRWLYYLLKPMDFVTGYLQSIQAGVDVAALNMEVDDRIFQGGATLLTVRSPRRFGNLRCNGEGYIGAGSITAWRNEQAAQRKLKRESGGRPISKRPPAKSRLARVVEQEAALRNPELQTD